MGPHSPVPAEAADELLHVCVPQLLQQRQLLFLLSPQFVHIVQVSLTHLSRLTLRLRQLTDQSLQAGRDNVAGGADGCGTEIFDLLTAMMSSRMST